ncbi:reverse transcriptase [Fusarium napiforme]|uniref:Reverse transcriptase n=1 Tax=Fusarium napiforme TaxID=42672 RepID=A0A8H5ISW6_9HYPO|nr:reverse transcriptase [Fusarium napiforme]
MKQKQQVKTIEAKVSTELLSIGSLKDTKERNERIEQELKALSELADQLAMVECKLDVSELTRGFEDFVERRRLRKEAGKGCHLEDSRHEEEELRWKKKLEKAEQELREGMAVKRGKNARSEDFLSRDELYPPPVPHKLFKTPNVQTIRFSNEIARNVCPEEFYISPANITRTEYKRNLRKKTLTDDARVNKDTWARFKKPKQRLEFWRRETGPNIDRAYGKYGRIWLVLQNLEEAQHAVSGEMYTLEGLQTSFDSLDPEYVPKQCFNCQDFGHMALQCPNEVRCGRCLEPHPTQDCDRDGKPSKCFFCGGNHPSYWLRVCRHPRVLDVLHRCSLWRGRASWDTKGQESEASGRPSSPDLRTEHDGSQPSFGIPEILREILSDQGAATPDEPLLSSALSGGGGILVRLIEACFQAFAPYLAQAASTRPHGNPAELRTASPSPSVLSARSRLDTATGDLSLASSPRASGRVLYDYANRSPAWQTPSFDGSLYGSGWNSNGASPARQVSVEPPFSSISELSDADFFMDTYEEPAQRDVFELSADCPAGSIFELAADHPLYPGGHQSSSIAEEVGDACGLAPLDSAPDVSLDGLPEIRRDMIVEIISIPSSPIGTEGEVDSEFVPDTPTGLLTCTATSGEPNPADTLFDPSPETSVARNRRGSSSTVTVQTSSASSSQACPEGSREQLALPPSSPDVGSSSVVIPCSIPDPNVASQPPQGSPPGQISSVGPLTVRKRRWNSDDDVECGGKRVRVEESLGQDDGESALAALSLSSPNSNSLSVTGTVLPDGPSLTESGSSLPLHENPSTPPLRRSPRGLRPSFTPGSSTASSSSSCSSGSSFFTVDSSPNTSALLESPATPSRGSSDQVPEDDSSLVAETSQGSLQIAPRDSPRPPITDDDEIADQLERDASQATNQQSTEGLVSSAEVVGTASEAQGLTTCAPVSTASPTDQERLENEIGPESEEEEEEEGAGSDDEYLPRRKPKARSKGKSKTGSRWKGKGVAREAPNTGPKQTKLDRYFS